jgi:hypothetical protein
MPIDLEALRQKHEQLNNPAAANQNSDFLQKFYKVPEGTNAVRILPWKDDDKEFYAETKIHRVPQGDSVKNIHCRKIHGEPCPMCDLYFGLWKTGKKEDEDLARKIKPRSRYYMNILDRASGDVKILSVGVVLFKKFIGTMLDEDFGDITDMEKGHDFKIVKEIEEGSPWPKYDQSQPRPKSSPVGSKAEIAAILDSLHDVHDLVKLEEYEEVKKSADMLRGVSVEGTTPPEPSEEVSDGDYLAKLQS